MRIIDWRFAPVARVFYRYEEGDAYEEWFGERLAEGTVEVRRLVVIERGRADAHPAPARCALERAPDGRVARAWAPGAALVGRRGHGGAPGQPRRGAGRAARARARFDVTALLDAEQYEALSVDADRPLLVLGSAGSGKTTVALHRLAKIAFDERARRTPSRG